MEATLLKTSESDLLLPASIKHPLEYGLINSKAAPVRLLATTGGPAARPSGTPNAHPSILSGQRQIDTVGYNRTGCRQSMPANGIQFGEGVSLETTGPRQVLPLVESPGQTPLPTRLVERLWSQHSIDGYRGGPPGPPCPMPAEHGRVHPQRMKMHDLEVCRHHCAT